MLSNHSCLDIQPPDSFLSTLLEQSTWIIDWYLSIPHVWEYCAKVIYTKTTILFDTLAPC